jgi:hypothetical protein
MAEAKDYKKERKDLYAPKTTPHIIEIPEMQFIAVEGRGNPNDGDGEYKKAVEVLYNVQYTIKMSKNGKSAPDGFFDYVVPPLEGLWWLDKNENSAWENKSKYCWISLIRLPEFVNEKVLEWACGEVQKKKNLDTQKAKILKITDGLCVQCMHIGSYNDEPKTLKAMEEFATKNGFKTDVNETRRHHEIYLSDPRKTEASKLKTVLRIPVKKNIWK